MTLLEVNKLKKIYTTRFGGNPVQALTNVSFSIEQGEFVAIIVSPDQVKQHCLISLHLLISLQAVRCC
jgi:putative ABC transport system ATP-binding protein